MGKNHGKTGDKKRKERVSASSAHSAVVSPDKKKHKQHGGRDGGTSESSESDSSESENEDTVESLVRQLAKDMRDQKKMLKDIRRKQDDITSNITNLEKRVETVEEKVSSIDLKLSEQGKSLDFVHSELKLVKDSQHATDRTQAGLLKTIDDQQCAINRLKEHANNLERKSRERNMRLVGFKERDGEIVGEIVKSVLSEKFDLAEPGIEAAHRVGRKTPGAGPGRPRHIIFRLSCVETKFHILNRKREALNGEEYYITEDRHGQKEGIGTSDPGCKTTAYCLEV